MYDMIVIDVGHVEHLMKLCLGTAESVSLELDHFKAPQLLSHMHSM